jgi:hypothetical protein
MWRHLCAVFVAILAPAICAQAGWQEDYEALLRKYNSPAGVRYAAWKRDKADVVSLNRVVSAIATARVPTDRSKALAFYIDAYNAWILHEALEKYPTRSVTDPLFTFFLGKRITVAGKKMSFNSLEKDIIRRKFSEPRIHFALNCASRSCPPLAMEPYSVGNLEKHLDAASAGFVNSDKGVRMLRDRVQLSKIFDWYREDFPEGVIPFINRYRREKIPADARIAYDSYDWSLNEAK